MSIPHSIPKLQLKKTSSVMVNIGVVKYGSNLYFLTKLNFT